ncbi:MAG: MBL fold metallo-hydrolase [Betaproteobacteria bacterium]
MTWVGHATVLLRVGGLSLLTDPHFSARASPVQFAGPRRVVPPVPALAELPHIDVVAISHNHYDHLDLASVAALAKQPGGSPRFFVPLGLKAWFERRGLREVRHPELSFLFTGDTGYSRDFADIGSRFGGFDLAAIPIGAYAPRWFMEIMHINPAEAVQVHKDVRARRSMAIHWGTFANLTDESLYEPPQLLAQERARAGLAEDDFFVLRHGETRAFARQ